MEVLTSSRLCKDGRKSIRECYKPNAALQMHDTLCSLTCWETASASELGVWVAIDTYEPPETSSPELMGAWILDRHVTEIFCLQEVGRKLDLDNKRDVESHPLMDLDALVALTPEEASVSQAQPPGSDRVQNHATP